MMVLDDSQSTQLRISKKITAVCSGKRSRFSKPRPNLAISKRGESNVPASVCTTSKKTEEEAVQTSLNSHVDSKLEEPVQNISHKDANKKTVGEEITSHDNTNKEPVENETEIISHENFNKIIVEEDVEIICNENTKKKVVEGDSEISCHDDVKKIAPVQSSQVISSTILKKSPSKKNIQIDSSTYVEKLDSEDDSNTKKLSPIEDIQDILNEDDVEKLFPGDEDIQVDSNTIVDKNSEEANIQRSPFKKSGKNSKENVQASPMTNSGSPSKGSESERSVKNVTPTVIDKSKYPHLTSILTKKRSEPRKEVQQKRRKKFKKGDAPPERSKMTMADLIYWNPAKTDEPHKNTTTVNEAPSENVVVEEERVVDDNDDGESENNIQESVPKLVISEDGTINIDQSSLFVSRNVPQPINTEIVRRDDTTYSSFRKRPLTKHWTAKDTANFYRALSLVGADFSLMEQIFPNRTRRELKQKFKREERFNIDLINKVLYESQTFDELTLNDFMDQNTVSDDPVNDKDDDLTVVKEKSRKQRTSKKANSAANESSDSSIDHLEEEIADANKNLQSNKGKKKKTKKLSDDEDVEILIGYTSYNDTGEHKSSKRKRNAKKLPDDFVSIDSLEDLEVLDNETYVNDEFEIENSSENCNDVVTKDGFEEIPAESASALLNKIYETVDVQPKEINSTATSLPSVPIGDEDYDCVEYVKSNDVDSDLSMLGNVMAYEVVNTLIPVPKKRRKIISVSPSKTAKLFLATKISPTNYTNYTPV